jgi:hypothetical protein
LRQECELEPPAPAAEPPSAGTEAAMMLGKILIGVPLGIMAAPYLIVGETAAILVGSPFVIAENSANKHQLEQRQQMRLGLSREETVALLGKLEIEFGLDDEYVIWIHDQYNWLNQLAKQAKEEQKHGK